MNFKNYVNNEFVNVCQLLELSTYFELSHQARLLVSELKIGTFVLSTVVKLLKKRYF